MSARSRFSDFLSQKQVKQNSPVIIIGAGGIGSAAAEGLARIGFDLIVWDDDTVGIENIGSQRYGFSDIHPMNPRQKVFVLQERLEKEYKIAVEPRPEKYEGQEELSRIVVCGVSDLETRAMIWERGIKDNPNIALYLDGRVGGERFKLFSLNPFDAEAVRAYETHLDLNKPRTQMPCTSRFSPQAGSALEWCITSVIKEYIAGNSFPFQIIGQNFNVISTFLGVKEESASAE